LRKRRYQRVDVRRLPDTAGTGDLARSGCGRLPLPPACAFLLLLDEQPLLTPGKRPLAVPTRALAERIAAEWAAQGAVLSPLSMPLTRLANTAIDGVCGREPAVRADIVKYAACDLLCYRAERPQSLVRRQRAAWDGVVAWACEALGVALRIGSGVMPIAQPGEVGTAVGGALAPFDCFALAALHVITTLTGSALLALALARGRLSAEAAWAAAHVDEEFQIAQWGEDAEAAARQQLRWAELQAASRMLQLLA
jgi:chaperone required for assembly of F1-ATPase